MAPQKKEFPTPSQGQGEACPALRRPYTLPTATFVSFELKERLASCGCAKTPLTCATNAKWSHK
jgi:hypothetical protein